MNIWSEMMTALRGGFDEVGEAVKTSQAVAIVEEEIRLLDKQLQVAREALADSLIKQKQAEQQVVALQAEVGKFEGYAVKALEQSDETLALEVAEQIAILEQALSEQQLQASNSAKRCEQLRQSVRQGEQNLKRAKQQRDTIKATSHVQSVQESMSLHIEGKNSRLKTARDVLERIKQQANNPTDDEEDLQSKLLKAGIINDSEEVSAGAVLARIKGKSTQ